MVKNSGKTWAVPFLLLIHYFIEIEIIWKHLQRIKLTNEEWNYV